jgi:hypothetical protein
MDELSSMLAAVVLALATVALAHISLVTLSYVGSVFSTLWHCIELVFYLSAVLLMGLTLWCSLFWPCVGLPLGVLLLVVLQLGLTNVCRIAAVLLAFAMFNWCCKQMWGSKAGTKPKTPQPTPIVKTPANWDDVSQVPQDSEEFSNVKAEFDGQCSVWAHAYPFTLALEAVYRINSPVLERTFREAHTNMHSKKPQTRLLYHGTAYASVKAICRGGFRLPSISGMFGKGIYFACSPLKSWQYSNRKTSEYMLACDVALGNAKKICEARRTFDPAVELRQPWWRRIVGVKGFDSLVAPCRQDGGAVNVPEYVIFHPDRALPRYVLEVRETRHTWQSL